MDVDSLPRPGGVLRPDVSGRPSRPPDAARKAEKQAETTGPSEGPHDGPFSGPYTASMTWDDVCAHPALQNLPFFKVELDQFGRVMLSPRGLLYTDDGELLERPMTWDEARSHPGLQNLPFKIELDHFGRVLMSPVSRLRSRYQYKIGTLLEKQFGEEVAVEFLVETRLGARSPDVVWMSPAFVQLNVNDRSWAPEICVEVQSPSSANAEMREKTALYLEQGAREVWICDAVGQMHFFSPDGQMERSALAPGFPAHVSL